MVFENWASVIIKYKYNVIASNMFKDRCYGIRCQFHDFAFVNRIGNV